MNKDTESFAMFVCVFALFCAILGFFLIILAGFSFTDLDYTEEQRRFADIYAGLIAFAGIVGLFFSGLLFFWGLSFSKSESEDSTKKILK
jgi:drug/metabolite transporter (DMT)-like permease